MILRKTLIFSQNRDLLGHAKPSKTTCFSMMITKNDRARRRSKEIQTESLSDRIHHLLENSKAIIVLPGKIGTLTELFVAWNTNYLYNISNDKDVVPIFLKKDYWKEIIDNMPEDMELSNNFFEYYENDEDLEKFIEKLD